MVSPVYTPIHILNVRKPNYDIMPLAEGMQAIRTAYDKRQEREARAAAQEEARQASAAKAEQDRINGARDYVSNIMTTLDPNAPDFAHQWGGHLAKLRESGHEIGPEYDDPKFGYSLALAEVTDAKQRFDMRNKDREFRLKEREVAAKGGEAMPVSGDEDPNNYGLDEDGRIIRVSDQVAGVEDSVGTSTSYGTTGGAQFGRTGRETASVPGVVVQDSGKAAPQWVTREAEGQEATARAPEEQQARVQRLRDVQAMWTRTYGRAPPSGYVYAEDGSLIDLKERTPRGGASRTQQAAAGAIKSAAETLEIAREALTGTDATGQPVDGGGTNVVTRGLSSATGSGTFARVQGLLEPAVRAVMHGMSGAQVNIPETESYMRSFMPHWTDSASTINFKLNHMKVILTEIESAIAGKQRGDAGVDEKIRSIQGEMRKALGLRSESSSGQSSIRPGEYDYDPQTGSFNRR